MWRKADKSRKSALTGAGSTSSSSNPHVPSHLVGADGEIMPRQPQQAQPPVAYPGNRGGLANQPLGNNDEDDEDEEVGGEEEDEERYRQQQHHQEVRVNPEEQTQQEAAVAQSTMGLFTQENSPIQGERVTGNSKQPTTILA